MKTVTIQSNLQTSLGFRIRCDRCEAAMIQGVFCHETGCPNSRKTWRDGEWVKVLHCRECGNAVEEGETCCAD